MPGRIIVSWSEIDAARHCALKHQLAYRERWVKEVTGPRSLGSAWHLVMQSHYLTLQQIQSELREQGEAPSGHPWDRWQYPEGTAERVHQAIYNTAVFEGSHAETVAWMYQGHLLRWGLNTDWTILAVEFQPVSWLPTHAGNRSRFDLKCKIDVVIQSLGDGLVWIVDHKSGQRRPDIKALNMDDQFGLYTWILRRLGRPCQGAILSWAKTTQPQIPDSIQDRFDHYHMDRSDTELDNIAADAYRTLIQVYSWDAKRYGDYPVYPNPEWCKRRCDFLNAHLAARRGFTTLRAYLQDTGFGIDKTRH